MAELDEITQKILLEGDKDLLDAFDKIKKDGTEAIESLAQAAEGGAGRMELLAGSIVAIGAALATAVTALIGFVEAQDSATQKTAFLAEALGTTVQNLQSVEAAFAQAGVSTQTFERFANRLTISIAQQWPEIAANIRTAATEQDAAQERMVAGNLRVKEATNALANNVSETSSRIAAANSRVEHTYVTLKFAAQEAAATAKHAMQSVEGATLSVTAAQQRLNTLLGNPPTEGEKKALAVSEAQLALEKARQAQVDARLAQQKELAEAAQKQKDIEQAAEDARGRAAKELEEATLRQVQLENAKREAVTQSSAIEEREAKRRTGDIGSISKQLEGIITSGKDASQSVDLTQVSVRNLERAVFNLASVGGKEPTGIEALHKLAELFSKDTENLIGPSQRLALVQKLSATSLANTGASASELLKVLSKGPAIFDSYQKSAEGAFQITDKQVEDVEKFKGAFEGLQQQLNLVQQSFAAALSPALSAIIEGITNSIKDSDGALHLFIQGIKGIGAALADFGNAINAVLHQLDALFNVPEGTTLKAIFAALVILVAAFGGALSGIPALFAIIVVAIGEVYENFGKLKARAEAVWEALKDNAVTRFFERLVDVVTKLKDLLSGLSLKGLGSGAATTATEGGAAPSNTNAFAGGGEVDGPGSTTSDSILARLSRGEFVVKAAAVQAYGAGLFHSLNNMQFPGFAAGGLVPSPVRLAGGGTVPATSVLNLSLDGRSFNGLRGPTSTIDDLSSFAISRQTSAAGSNPSWMK